MRDKRRYILCKKDIFKIICNRRSGISAFIFKGSAVGAFGFGGVYLVASNFDMIKGAAVAVLAVICAVVDVAANVSVCFHKMKTSFFLLILFLIENQSLFGRKSSI